MLTAQYASGNPTLRTKISKSNGYSGVRHVAVYLKADISGTSGIERFPQACIRESESGMPVSVIVK
jgi:hypothetical protein